MPVYGKSDALSEGLGAMSQVVEGYIRGEEIAHQRAVQEREYAFRQEQFEESTRRYDTSLEEQMFEFDTQLAFRAEQSALGREEVRFLQEDIQAEARTAAEVQRTYATEEAVKTREFRAKESSRQRAVDYTRIKSTEDAQRARRQHEAENNERYQYLNYLGGYPNYQELPKSNWVALNGERWTDADLERRGGLVLELHNITKNPGSRTFVTEAVDAELAQKYLDSLERGSVTEKDLLNSLKASKAIGSEPNSRVITGLMDLAMRKSGVVNEEAWWGLSEENRDHWNQSVIRDLNGMEGMERKLRQDEINMMITETQIKAGTYPGARSPYAAEAADNGMYFMWDPDEKRPVHTGKGSDALQAMDDKLLRLAVEYQTYGAQRGQAEMDQDEAAADFLDKELARILVEMNEVVPTVETLIAADNGDTSIARKLVNEYIGRAKGGQGNPENWMDERHLFAGEVVSDGSVAQPKLDPNDPLYEQHVKLRAKGEALKGSQERLGATMAPQVAKEATEEGRATLQRQIDEKNAKIGAAELANTFAADTRPVGLGPGWGPGAGPTGVGQRTEERPPPTKAEVDEFARFSEAFVAKAIEVNPDTLPYWSDPSLYPRVYTAYKQAKDTHGSLFNPEAQGDGYLGPLMSFFTEPIIDWILSDDPERAAAKTLQEEDQPHPWFSEAQE